MKELYLPEGRKNSQPIVTVRPSVIEKLGEPKVNYDQLEDLFRRELAIDPSITPTIRLFGRKATPQVGFYPFFTHTIHVNAVSAETLKWKKTNEKKPKGEQISTMNAVMHEGQHLSDSVNHRLRTSGEAALRVSSLVAGTVLGAWTARNFPEAGQLLYAFGQGLLTYSGYYFLVDPSEKRAHKTAANTELNEKYGDAIIFPVFDRTQSMNDSNKDALK